MLGLRLTTNASFTLVVTMWIISKQNVVAPDKNLALTGGNEDLTPWLLKALLFSTTHSKSTCVNRRSSILLYLSIVLLSAAWDIEANLGPGCLNSNYPCGLSIQPVTFKQDTICCDSCDTWIHKPYINMSTTLFEHLVNSDVM